MSTRKLSTRKQPARHEVRLLAGLLLITPLSPAASAEETLGRLFFTPEQRQSLDRQRQMNIQTVRQASDDPTLTIDGMVTRSSGRRTAWVNGVAQHDGSTTSGVATFPSPGDPGRVTIGTGNIPEAKMKVGQTFHQTSGTISNGLGEGRITTPGTPSPKRKTP